MFNFNHISHQVTNQVSHLLDDLFKKDPVTCDSVAPMANFDPTSYMGLWYEIYHAKNQDFQPDSWICTTAKYTNLDLSTGKFDVSNTSQASFGGPRFGISGSAVCPAPEGEALNKCAVKFFPW